MLPVEMYAVIKQHDGHEGTIDLEQSGWQTRDDVRSAEVFSLVPKPEFTEQNLPTIVVHLGNLPDGTKKQLVYFSRVFGNISTSAVVGMSAPEDQHDLFRLYCLGWKAVVGGREVEVRMWAYPGGSVVAADEPPFIQQLIEHHSALMKS